MSLFPAMLKIVAAIVLLFAVSAMAEYEEDDDVIILTEANFDEVIKNNKFVLVEFYAPWCGHCKQLEPHFKKVGSALADSDLPEKVVVAALDATVHGSVAGKFGVRGYPTLKWFREGIAADYKGGRTEETILEWIEKHVGPATKALNSAEEVDAFFAENELSAVGFFSSTTGDDFKQFEAVATSFDDIPFAYIADTSVGKTHGLKKGSGVVLVKPFDDKKVLFSEKINVEKLNEFVENNRFPLVVPFSDDAVPRIFQNKFGQSIFIFSNDAVEGLQELAEANKNKIAFTIVDDSQERLLEYLGVDADDYPAVIISETRGNVKYRLEGEVNEKSIKDFLSKFFAKKLKPYLKSEPLPEDNSGPVKTVVSKNFNDIVLDKKKHVFIEFYAPWCGHCKQLSPIWDELGEYFAKHEEVVVAKMDSTANEVTGLSVQSYPTLKYFPAGKKTVAKGKDYDGERNFEALKKWIVDKAGIIEEDEQDSKDEL